MPNWRCCCCWFLFQSTRPLGTGQDLQRRATFSALAGRTLTPISLH
jgi:hypothetical protein